MKILDILCVFGRGIEKVGNSWEPTQYIEELSEKNQHPGVRVEGITSADDNPRVVIAGARMNVLAAAALYKNQVKFFNRAPKAVIFAAGKPAYIADDPDPDLTEGKILKRVFLREVPKCASEILIQAKNKNTYDDLVETLRFAAERRCCTIGIVTVLVHIARSHKFLLKARWVDPPLAKIDVSFHASEPIVIANYLGFDYLWEEMISSAYARTAERERKGINDLRSGRYNFGSQGYSFAKDGTK